ncbi:MAG: hypothetical protein PF485_13800 [Bacteroidales bacterium]|jgi:hypothetical protein|nr:hypothetical protein [Bacteroidales bacterium]
MEFKQLELNKESNWFKKIIRSSHTKKSLIYTAIGAIGGLVYYYITEGKHLDVIIAGDILKTMLIGGLLGFFITNSPCARNKC